MGDAFIVRRGGGANLNFKVVGGTTAPSSPTDNTIWVNTSTAITGWIFSATQPTAPTNGLLWIFAANKTAVQFEALKKNSIFTSLSGCKQYINGAWEYKEAKIYQGGVWIDLTYYLYNSGNAYENITGGWVATYHFWNSDTDAEGELGAPTISFGEESMVIQHSYPSSTSGKGGLAYIKNPIDLTEYSTLKVEGTFNIGRVTNKMYVWESMDFKYTENSGVARLALSGITDVAQIDISSLTGEYYIGFGGYCSKNNPSTITIKRISLLK